MRPARIATLLLLVAVLVPPASAKARNWGSVIFDLVDPGLLAATRAEQLRGRTLTYQRLRDGELLTADESLRVEEDSVDGDPVYRVEVARWDDTAQDTLQYVVWLDRTTLRPLGVETRDPAERHPRELVYERDQAVLSVQGEPLRELRIREDTVDYLTLQLMLLKFLDDGERMTFSFLNDDVLYRFYATAKGTETVMLGANTYDTLHVVCAMRGTWAILAPKLHFWIERESPHRMVRFQVRREVVELVE